MDTSSQAVTEFLSRIDELLELTPGSIRLSQELAATEQWDSMAVLGLLALADEKYGVVIKPADLMECRTFEDVFKLLVR